METNYSSKKEAGNLQTEERSYNVGDCIPMDKAEKTGTFHLTMIAGEKYLVNHEGKIVLKVLGKPTSSVHDEGQSAPEAMNPIAESKADDSPPMKLRFRPGTLEFSKAVEEADLIIRFYMDGIRRDFRSIWTRFENFLENNNTPYVKYLELSEDPEANLKAHLIREFFSRSNVQERGLEIMEFLTTLIAMHPDGSFNSDSQLSDNQQRLMILGFLEFVRCLGDGVGKRWILERTYNDFVNNDFNWMKKEGGVGYYINASLSKSLKAQRDFLINERNRYHMERIFTNLLRVQLKFFLDNMLAYIKTIALLRLMANSRKEDRGQDDNEREMLICKVIMYRPDWYPKLQSQSA